MPPSKPACQAVATYYKSVGIVSDKIAEIYTAIKRILTVKTKLKWGSVGSGFGSIIDAVQAELSTAINSVASRVTENLTEITSNMAAIIFQQIFALVLKILLAFPTAIFALVSLPQDAAIKAARIESKLLNSANERLNRILYIVLKWTKGKSGTDYYNKMQEALPYVTEAINQLKDVIHGLNGEPIEPGEYGNNSVFKEGVYKKMKNNVEAALSLSKTESLLEQRFSVNKRLEREKDSIYQEKATVIKQDYRKKRLELSDKYVEDMSRLGTDDKDLKDSLKEHQIRLEYQQQIDIFTALRDERLAIAKLQAETESLFNKDVWTGAFKDTSAEFMGDLKIIKDELYKMLAEIKDAYIKNKESQLHANSLYDMKNIIRRIISEMISFIRNRGNEAGQELAEVLEEGQDYLEVVEDEYSFVKRQGSDVNASELATSLSTGYGALIAANATFETIVVDSLVDLINSDDVLDAENNEYNLFLSTLASIPDWDGSTGVWAVNMANSSVTPYIQLIADMTEMLAKIPLLAFNKRAESRRKVDTLIKNTKGTFRVLQRHNRTVLNALSSYTPYSGSEAGDLKKILANAGLLDKFVQNMSLAALVVDLGVNFSDQFGTELPTVKNCRAFDAYPELFGDKNVVKGAREEELDAADPRYDEFTQSLWEEESRDRKTQHMFAELELTDTPAEFDTGDDALAGSGEDSGTPTS